MLVWPCCDASINAVQPPSLVALMQALCRSSSCTTSFLPLSAAHSKGVMLLHPPPRLSTSTPLRSSLFTWAKSGFSAAKHSASEGEWSPEEEQTLVYITRLKLSSHLFLIERGRWANRRMNVEDNIYLRHLIKYVICSYFSWLRYIF